MSAPVVDVHCHTFNAADLPVRGFLQRVHLHAVPLGATLAQLVDATLQGGAPGYHQDRARLDALLAHAGAQVPLEPAAASLPDLDAELDLQVEAAMHELQSRDPQLLVRLGADLLAAERRPGAPEALVPSPSDLYRAARRAVRWVKLFGRSRLDVTAHLVAAFGDRVDLYCSLLVDLGAGLGDVAPTTVRQQVELQEKISRLTMQGRLPRGGDARVHPFVGFDPRHELRARAVGDVETPLEVVQAAVQRYGFVGVKLYPPMGWRPLGNERSPDLTAAEGSELDALLRGFYGWCEREQVPVTAHCNDSHYAHDSYRDFSNPDNWVDVLREFPELHLNLGHAGGARADEPADGWPWRIAQAAGQFEHLYADVANHAIHRPGLLEAYLDMLEAMFSGTPTAAMARRLMFGSDWYMLAIQPEHEQFLDAYREGFEERFGAEAAAAFTGGTALRFLGFDDPDNRNARRLRARYETYAPDRVPTWLA